MCRCWFGFFAWFARHFSEATLGFHFVEGPFRVHFLRLFLSQQLGCLFETKCQFLQPLDGRRTLQRKTGQFKFLRIHIHFLPHGFVILILITTTSIRIRIICPCFYMCSIRSHCKWWRLTSGDCSFLDSCWASRTGSPFHDAWSLSCPSWRWCRYRYRYRCSLYIILCRFGHGLGCCIQYKQLTVAGPIWMSRFWGFLTAGRRSRGAIHRCVHPYRGLLLFLQCDCRCGWP
mmetsp:Transcript_14222/g.25801  ORF Transcript_14222/g.25801 Transcript_14222/m.25801 type:complete len:231 (+) Transcript_14222:300-992(+)